MASVERTVTVPQPISTVWDFMTDFTTTEQWDPPTVTTERLSGDGGVGTTYHNVSELLGNRTDVTYTVVEHEPTSRFVLTGDAGSVQLRDTITFEETGDGGTAVTYHAEFVPQGAAKLATPLLPPALKILGDKVAASLEETLRGL